MWPWPSRTLWSAGKRWAHVLLSVNSSTSGQITFPSSLLRVWKTEHSPQPRAPGAPGNHLQLPPTRLCRIPDPRRTKPLITPTKHCHVLLCAPTWACDLGTTSRMARKQMFMGAKGRRPWSSKSNSCRAGQVSFLFLCVLGAASERGTTQFLLHPWDH